MGSDHLPAKIRKTLDNAKKGATSSQREILDILDRQLVEMVPVENMGGMIGVSSVVLSKSKQPMVRLEWGATKGELSVLEARQHALKILECCEAAIYDASIFAFMHDNAIRRGDTEADAEQQGAGMVELVRNHRKKFEEAE